MTSATTTTVPPPLPPRRQDSVELPDDPPPAYEARPSTNSHEQTLEYGPSRPFQPAHPPPHQPIPFAMPSTSSLPPPSFPFWNGHSLTQQQTGFMAGPLQPPTQQTSPYGPPMQAPFHAPPHSPPGAMYPQSTGGSSHFSPPPTLPPRPSASSSPSPPKRYEPTLRPTSGQPLLRNGMLLVYPQGKAPCWKCENTGYKPFVGTGGDDPNHPCKRCWEKYGKPFDGAIKIAASSPEGAPANYQRPLRPQPPLQSRSHGYRPHVPPGGYPGNGPGSSVRMMHGGPPPGANAIVLRPGDPRIGGYLCQRCGGDGLVWGFLFEETCPVCFGTGRIL